MTRRPTIPVEVGQVRLDPDPRQKGARTVTVLETNWFRTYVKSSAGIRTHILTSKIAKWPLVEPTPET